MPTPCCFDLLKLKHDPTNWGVVFATSSQYDMLNDIMYDEHDMPLKSIMATATVESSKAEAFRASIESGEMVPPPGTLVAWLSPLHGYVLVAENEVTLTGRLFSRGDLVVSDERPGQTGIVLHSKSTCSLHTVWSAKHKDHPPTLSCMPREDFPQAQIFLTLTDNGVVDNIDLCDLETTASLHVGAGVTYQGWAGIVVGVDEEKTIRLFNNSVVVLDHEVYISHAGEIRPDRPEGAVQAFELGGVVTARKTDLRLGRWLFGCYDASLAPIGVVVKLRPTRAKVEWQTHQSDRLSVDIDRTIQSPPEYLGLDEMDSPSFFVNDSGRSSRYNTPNETTASGLLLSHVRFGDPEMAKAKYGDRPNASKLFQNGRQTNLGFDMNIFRLNAVDSKVTVRWQDASVTTLPSMKVLKTEPTENNVYHPGTLVITTEMKPLSENPTAGFADAPRKVGIVQTCDQNKCIAMVRWFKDPRLYLDKDKDYGAVPDWQCGELSQESEAVSTYDLVQPGGLDFVAYDFVRLKSSDASVSDEHGWLGFITDIHPDATISVCFQSPKEEKDVRVHVDDVEIAMDVEASSMNPFYQDGDEHMSDGSETGSDSGSDVSMESGDDVGAILMGDRKETVDYILDESGDPLDGAASEHSSAWSTASEGAAEQARTVEPAMPPGTNGQHVDSIAEPATLTAQYTLHDGPAPAYHRYSSDAGQLSTSSLRKVMKEHTILSHESAIPPGIYVHSWEGNCNLLRAIIVGPTETPYAHCPFMFDILLPASYPTKPPRVFFAHWRNSLSGPDRRINPNLYEDGTVCLSLLNTWPGASTEGWMPGKSTLLQILISIQSLILVPEPYYNEPGFEAKRQVTGIKDSSVAYNEQTLLQARGFLLHSLLEAKEIKDKGTKSTELTDTIEHLYLSPEGPSYLHKLIRDDTALIQRSETADEDTQRRRNGVDLISPGACLRLKRMLQSLEAMVVGIDGKIAS